MYGSRCWFSSKWRLTTVATADLHRCRAASCARASLAPLCKRYIYTEPSKAARECPHGRVVLLYLCGSTRQEGAAHHQAVPAVSTSEPPRRNSCSKRVATRTTNSSACCPLRSGLARSGSCDG